MSDDSLFHVTRIRGTLLGGIIGAAAATAIASLVLYAIPGSFLSIIVAPIVGFVLPYYMGLRKWKHLLIYSIIFLVVLSLAFDAAYTNYIYSSSPLVSQDNAHNTTAGYYFGRGGVAPRYGNTNTEFAFNVSFFHPVNGTRTVTVNVLVAAITTPYSLNRTMVPVSNVTVNNEIMTTYHLNLPLNQSSIYELEYTADAGGTWINSTISIGVLTLGSASAYEVLLYPSFLFVLLSIATLYVGVVLIAVLLLRFRKRSTTARRPNPAGGSRAAKVVKKERFVCSNCGQEVDSDATSCPNCGERFE